MKICIYSTDTFGLGHISRSWKIANSFLKTMGPEMVECLLLSSSDAFWRMVKPIKGIDFVKLPSQLSIRSNTGEKSHQPKFLSITSSSQIRQLRSDLIKSILQSYSPDLFIVDYSATGTNDELLPTLEYLKTVRGTRIAIAYRDIIGSVEYTQESWNHHNTIEVLHEYYDGILIFGDPQVFDFQREYKLPSTLVNKVTWMGYLVNQIEISSINSKNGILITIGGGSDGIDSIRNVLDRVLALTSNEPITIVLGPDMPQDQIANNAIAVHYNNSNIQIIEHTYPLVKLIQKSKVCISLAGYNTMCEIIGTNTPSYVIPRDSRQKEQTIRAELFEKLNLVKRIVDSDTQGSMDINQLIDFQAIQENRSLFCQRQNHLANLGFKSLL
jgi:predicted glycosyltransferase